MNKKKICTSSVHGVIGFIPCLIEMTLGNFSSIPLFPVKPKCARHIHGNGSPVNLSTRCFCDFYSVIG